MICPARTIKDAESINNYIIIKICKKMKRRNYEIPAMRVVELRQRVRLLVGSGVSASRTGYTAASEQEEVWN